MTHQTQQIAIKKVCCITEKSINATFNFDLKIRHTIVHGGENRKREGVEMFSNE